MKKKESFVSQPTTLTSNSVEQQLRLLFQFESPSRAPRLVGVLFTLTSASEPAPLSPASRATESRSKCRTTRRQCPRECPLSSSSSATTRTNIGEHLPRRWRPLPRSPGAFCTPDRRTTGRRPAAGAVKRGKRRRERGVEESGEREKERELNSKLNSERFAQQQPRPLSTSSKTPGAPNSTPPKRLLHEPHPQRCNTP